jgi:hypothetical protein
MPDPSGKLTPDEKDRAAAWVNEKWRGNRVCPICGSTRWILGDHLVQPIVLGNKQNILLSGVSYPHLMVISPSCGYTMFVNAVIVGLVEPSSNEMTTQTSIQPPETPT